MNICLYGSSSDSIDSIFLEESFKTGEELALRGHTLVYGAGGEGVMGAAARGAASKGGIIIGIVPAFLDLGSNLFPDCTELIKTEDMRSRKALLESRSDAFIVMPGGLGTFDEFFEIATLRQLGRHGKAIAVCNIDGYYDEFEAMFEKAIRRGFMSEKNHEVCRFFRDRDEMFGFLEFHGEKVLDIREMKIIK